MELAGHLERPPLLAGLHSGQLQAHFHFCSHFCSPTCTVLALCSSCTMLYLLRTCTALSVEATLTWPECFLNNTRPSLPLWFSGELGGELGELGGELGGRSAVRRA